MNFTFGIITDGNNDTFIKLIIASIINNQIPNYEIIIVGNTSIKADSDNIKIILFNENIKRGWITRKKNIIVEQAVYENIVLMHDYVILNDDWYRGFLEFGDSFDFCISKIINTDGLRFRDYTLFPYKVDYLDIHYSPGDINKYYNNVCLLPYDFINNIKTNKYMYISGAYYIIKRAIALKYPLDEKLVHCGGEDVEYSKRLHANNIIIKCNKHSSVRLLKYKPSMSWEKEIGSNELYDYVNYCNNT